jgi:hypothetical protein
METGARDSRVIFARYADGMDHALARHVFWLYNGAMLALAMIYPVYAGALDNFF